MKLAVTVLILNLAAGCQKPSELTAAKAESVVRSEMFSHTPAYAEVPQKVVYGPRSPKDDYDGKAVRTLENLQRSGLVTVTKTEEADGTVVYQATVTKAGFHLLGTAPSMRGPAFRGRIAEKVLDGMRDFQRHPNDPTVGRAEVVWHYEKPTAMYDLFETKIDKPLNKPFVSLASFYWDKGWKFSIVVQKERAK
ncbi:MAG: hypothetical protein ABI718_16540 [Acidobacteriota bacterium]